MPPRGDGQRSTPVGGEDWFAIGIVAAAVLAMGVWCGAQLATLIGSGSWLNASIADALGAMIRLPAHQRQIAQLQRHIRMSLQHAVKIRGIQNRAVRSRSLQHQRVIGFRHIQVAARTNS